MLLDFKRDSWKELSRWGTWVHRPSIETRTVEDDEAFCSMKYQKFLDREDITVIALDNNTGQMIGGGGLHNCNWDILMFTLGFLVRTGQTGKGYATEIGSALLKYAFNELGASKVAADHAEGNIGSQRVIEKLGFKKEGVLRKCHNLYEYGIVDEHHYGILREEYCL